MRIHCRAALAIGALLLGRMTPVHAQGVITFDAHPLWTGTSYFESGSGVGFQVVVPQGPSYPYYDGLVILPPNWANNVPQNNTPFMGWFRQNNPYNYVSLSLTGGSLFGLTSVQLADPNSPSVSPVSISFVGYLVGGSSMTNIFTTPGNGATTFASYTFSSDMAKPQFTHLDILAPRWAMDDLVFSIPEPSGLALLGLGTLALFYWRKKL